MYRTGRKLTVLMMFLYYSACFGTMAFAGPSDIDEAVQYEDEETFGFGLIKTGSSGPMDGAIFRLYSSSEDAAADAYPMYFSVDTSKNIYYACEIFGCSGDGCTEYDIHAGKADIRGLKPGIYYLVEIEAPAGYQKLPFAFQVIIDEDGGIFWREEISAEEPEETGDGFITVENRAALPFPGTGEDESVPAQPDAPMPPAEESGHPDSVPDTATPSDASPSDASPSDMASGGASSPSHGASHRGQAGSGSSGGAASSDGISQPDAPEDNENFMRPVILPETGDRENILAGAAVFVLSGILLAIALWFRRNKKT